MSVDGEHAGKVKESSRSVYRKKSEHETNELACKYYNWRGKAAQHHTRLSMATEEVVSVLP